MTLGPGGAVARLLIVIVLLIVIGCSASRTPSPTPVEVPADLAITDATIVDVRSGNLLPRRTILIRGDTIVAVLSAAAPAPAAARVVDGAGLYAIPGLWDMHVHALWDDAIPDALFPRFIAAGITGIRDMGGTADVLLRTRERIARGELTAPRVVAAGLVLDGPEPVDPSISIAVSGCGGRKRRRSISLPRSAPTS